jgi:hypothetical protein
VYSEADLLYLVALQAGCVDLFLEEGLQSPQKGYSPILSPVMVCKEVEKVFLQPVTLDKTGFWR